MALRHWKLALALAGVAMHAAACRPSRPWWPWQKPAPAASPRSLPEIPVYEIAPRSDSTGLVVQPTRLRDPLANIPRSRRVTLTTNNADARTLLLLLAQEGEVSLVVSQDVQARVSVSFRDVPVADAMRAVIAEAGLSVLVGEHLSPWPPVVFYQLPVNVSEASAAAIAARFGVSGELAKWIVESRPKPD